MYKKKKKRKEQKLFRQSDMVSEFLIKFENVFHRLYQYITHE